MKLFTIPIEKLKLIRLIKTKNVYRFFLNLILDILNKFKDIYESYPSPLRVWLGNRLYIAIYEPEQLKVRYFFLEKLYFILFINNKLKINFSHFFKAVFLSPKAIEKDDLYKFMRPWLGTGLFTSPGTLIFIFTKN